MRPGETWPDQHSVSPRGYSVAQRRNSIIGRPKHGVLHAGGPRYGIRAICFPAFPNLISLDDWRSLISSTEEKKSLSKCQCSGLFVCGSEIFNIHWLNWMAEIKCLLAFKIILLKWWKGKYLVVWLWFRDIRYFEKRWGIPEILRAIHFLMENAAKGQGEQEMSFHQRQAFPHLPERRDR